MPGIAGVTCQEGILGKVLLVFTGRPGLSHLCRGAINGPLGISLDHPSVPLDTVC